eukprot:1071426-Amorphochlora_amoeboformis.AAC.1
MSVSPKYKLFFVRILHFFAFTWNIFEVIVPVERIPEIFKEFTLFLFWFPFEDSALGSLLDRGSSESERRTIRGCKSHSMDIWMVDQSKGMRLLGQVICSPDTQVSSLITRIHHEQVMCVILFRENGRFLSVFNANHLMDKILFPMLLKSVYVVRIREDKFAEVYCATGDGSLWLVEISCSMGNSEFRIRRVSDTNAFAGSRPKRWPQNRPAVPCPFNQASTGLGKRTNPSRRPKKGLSLLRHSLRRLLTRPQTPRASVHVKTYIHAPHARHPLAGAVPLDPNLNHSSNHSTFSLVSSNLPMGTLIHRSWDSCSILAAAPGVSKIISCPEAKSKKRDEALCHASPTSGPLTAVLAIRLRSLGKQSLSEDKEDADPTIAPILPPAAGRAVFGERLSSAGAEVVLEGGEEGRVWCKWRGEGEGDGGVAPKAFDVGERVAGIHYLRGRLSVKGSGVSLVEALLVVSQKGQTCVMSLTINPSRYPTLTLTRMSGGRVSKRRSRAHTDWNSSSTWLFDRVQLCYWISGVDHKEHFVYIII